MKKTCTKCGVARPLEDFHRKSRSKDGRASECRFCKKITDAARYRQHKTKHRAHVNAARRRNHEANALWVYRYLQAHPCVDCTQAEPILLEFDHVRGEKRATISEMIVGSYSLKSIKAEIAKCDVRCLYCHRRRTAAVSGWLVLALEAQEKAAPAS